MSDHAELQLDSRLRVSGGSCLNLERATKDHVTATTVNFAIDFGLCTEPRKGI